LTGSESCVIINKKGKGGGWITIDGTHVQIDGKGNLKGAVGNKIQSTSTGTGYKGKSESKGSSGGGSGKGSSGSGNANTSNTNAATAGHQTSEEYFGKARTRSQKEVVMAKKLSESSGTQVSKQEARKMRETVDDFTIAGYLDMRDAYTNPNASTKSKEKLQTLESFIAKSPKYNGGELYRGIQIDAKDVSSFKVGKTIDMKGPSSWSSDKNVANNFANAGKQKPKGQSSVVFSLTKAKKATSIKHLSRAQDEEEVLASSLSKYTIKAMSKKNGTTHITLEEN
jgi:hypothetical protein